MDTLRKKLHSHIIKSEPFVEIWRRARQVCECVYVVVIPAGCRLVKKTVTCHHSLLWIPWLYSHPVFHNTQIQELSNRAAARYDKANSQHLAAKEMIRVAESQLAERRAELRAQDEEPSSPSPLDLAWQEMLNHATSKVRLLQAARTRLD